MERKLRGCGVKHILGGPATKRPSEWKAFLSNDENKTQLSKLLLDVWSDNEYAPRLQGRRVMVTYQGAVYLLTSEDGTSTTREEVDFLQSSQEETDTRVGLYSDYAASRNYHHVCIKSPDSDIFFILLHHAPSMNVNIIFNTKIDNKTRLISISEIANEYGQEKCTALLGFHSFTGCDTTSAFRGKGKLNPVKKMLKSPNFVTILAKLGDSWNTHQELVDQLETFTCVMYGCESQVGKVNDIRLNCIQKLCTKEGRSAPKNVDRSALPPCRKTLEQHVRRVNFQAAVWKLAKIYQPNVPEVHNGHGWVLTDQGLRPLWYEGETQPSSLEEIAQEEQDDLDSEGSDSEYADSESEMDLSEDSESDSD